MAAGGGRWLLDAARQRSIRGAMVARLHLFPTCLPPPKPDLASNKKTKCGFHKNAPVLATQHPQLFFLRRQKRELSLSHAVATDVVQSFSWRWGWGSMLCIQQSGAIWVAGGCLVLVSTLQPVWQPLLLHRHPCKNGGTFHFTFLLPLYLM